MAGEKPVQPLEGIGSLRIEQSILEEYNREKGKVKQQIWLPIEYFVKILEIKNKTGIAVNTLCSLIVMSALKNIQMFTKVVEVEKPLEVRTKQFVYPCLLCWEEFFEVEKLKVHVSNVHKISLDKLIRNE